MLRPFQFSLERQYMVSWPIPSRALLRSPTHAGHAAAMPFDARQPAPLRPAPLPA